MEPGQRIELCSTPYKDAASPQCLTGKFGAQKHAKNNVKSWAGTKERSRISKKNRRNLAFERQNAVFLLDFQRAQEKQLGPDRCPASRSIISRRCRSSTAERGAQRRLGKRTKTPDEPEHAACAVALVRFLNARHFESRLGKGVLGATRTIVPKRVHLVKHFF